MKMPEKGGYKYWQLGNREWLYQKYWVEELSFHLIAEIVGCANSTVFTAFKILGIPWRGKSEALKGLKRSEETKLKISKAHEGVKRSEETRLKMAEGQKGKQLSKGTKRKLSAIRKEWHKNNKHPLLGSHHSEETIAKMKEKRKHQIFLTHHTKPELIFIYLYHKFGLANRVQDTSNNSFHVGRLNPDFIIRDTRIAIFVNGDYWHSPLLRYNIRDTQRVGFQIKECKKHKWGAIIIWESDLLREDAEQFVLSLLRSKKVI